MPSRRLLLATAAALLCAATPAAAASSVAYVDNHNAWLSSPDGAHKFQLTTGGDADASWTFPSSGPDGKTVVAHRDTFEDGSRRPVLYLYGADGKLITANVMPVYAGATVPVYPIGMDMDWDSKAVAYGYSYCTFACQSTVRGYWLTFSDQQSLYPTDPQGQRDAYNPTFFGRRVISSDSGGRIFVQPDVEEAPFTNSYQGWLSAQGFYFSRAEVSPAGNLVSLEWSQYDDQANKIGEGIAIGRHQGTVPSDLTSLCDVPVAADSDHLSFSPDGTMMTWADAEGVKVSGVPNLDAGTGMCTLTQPVKVISATGRTPSFGGADVAAIVAPPKAGADAPGGPAAPGATGTPGTPAAPGGTGTPGGAGPAARPLTVKLTGKATSKLFAQGKVSVAVDATGPGRLSAVATIPTRLAKKLRVRASAAAARFSGVKGIAAASSVVVARGSATAKAPGRVTIRLKPTRSAKRAAKQLRKRALSVRITQGAASGTTTLRLR